jgi:hypothetical protein
VGTTTEAAPRSARDRRVAIALANPAFFGETYMRPYDDEWTAPLPRVAQEMLGFAMSVRRGVLMMPPEFLKTTALSQVYPLWLTYRYAAAGKLALLHGALLSEYQDLARRNLSVVAWHIEQNPRLRADFVDVQGRPLVEPDPQEDKWTDDELVVRRPGASKDPTWQAAGIHTQIQGARLRHLIGDDVVTPLSSASPAKQKEAIRIWDQQTTARLVDEGQAIIAGNYNHPKDLLSMIAARTRWQTMRRPALHVAGDKEKAPDDFRDPDAVEALPEKWPKRRLFEEASDKPATFPVVYLLRSSTAGGALLRSGWVTRITAEQIPAIGRVYLLSLDPAPGAEVDPDPSFFNISVGILTPSHLDVIESYADRMEPTEQAEVLSAKVAHYRDRGHVGGIAMSKVALDRYAKGAFEVGDMSLRPLLHPHSLPQGSKIERLGQLGTYFKGGWARVTETAWMEQTAAEEHRDQETTLAEEWTTLPAQRHDDRLDGLDLLVREARGRLGVVVAQQAAEGANRTPGYGNHPLPTDGERIMSAQW